MPIGVERRKLHVKIGADGHGDGGRGEDEFNQGREAGDKPAGRAKGAVGVGKGPPACGMAVVSSVKLKIKAQYIAAMASATIIKPSVPAWDQP